MFKSPGQRSAFFNALKNKAAGIPGSAPVVPPVMVKPQTPVNPIAHPPKVLPGAEPAIGAQSPPSMSSSLNKPMIDGQSANPAGIKPPNPMAFLKIRRTLKPKV